MCCGFNQVTIHELLTNNLRREKMISGIKEKVSKYSAILSMSLIFMLVSPVCFLFGLDLLLNANVGSEKYSCLGCAYPLTNFGSSLLKFTGFIFVLVSAILFFFGTRLIWVVFKKS